MGIWSDDDREETDEEAAGSPAPREAVIGSDITIDGEVTGSEDLTIDGRVTGSIDLGGHALTVGREGEVEADIAARAITVAGEVAGDLTADDRVTLRESARVEGDIDAPAIELEEGSYFRGEVDMGAGHERSSGESAAPSLSAGRSRSASPDGDGSREAVADDEKEIAALA